MSVIYTQGGAASVADATTTSSGKVRLATIAEAGGTSEAIAVTPAGLQAEISGLTSGIIYRGSIAVADFGTTLASASLGDYYKISTGGTSGGVVYSVGDSIIVNADMGGTFADAKLDKIDNVDPSTSDELIGNHNATNYTATNSDTLTTHLSGLDAKLGTFATVATSGAYSDLSGTPTITAAGLALLDDADAAAQRTTLGLNAVASSGAYSDLTGTPTLATVATSGDYDDLSNKPTLATVATSGDYDDLTNKPTLATVATSGSYADLSNKPSADDINADHATPSNYTAADVNVDDHLVGIDNALGLRAPLASPTFSGTPEAPTATAGTNTQQIATTAFVTAAVASGGGSYQPLDTGLTSIANLSTSGDEIIYTTASDTYATASITAAGLALLDDADATAQRTTLGLSAVASSGAYSDLTGTPTLATVATSGDYDDLSNKPTLATVATSGAYADLSGTPTLATVATSGDYDDLSNKPSADDLAADHTAQNYTASNANIDGHLSGIDAKLATLGGSTNPNIYATTSSSYSPSASDAPDLNVWYGAASTGNFTLTLPSITSVLTGTGATGSVVETFEMWVGRAVDGDIIINATDGIDGIGGASNTNVTTLTVSAGQWLKIIGWKSSSTNGKYLIGDPQSAPVDSVNGATGPVVLSADDINADHANPSNYTAGDVNIDDHLVGIDNALGLRAPLASPAFSGTPTSTTPSQGDNSTKLATTAYVDTATAGAGGISNVVEDTTPQLGGDLDPNGNAISGALIPSAANTHALGSASAEWSDLFLGDGAVINFGDDQDIKLSHVGDQGLVLEKDPGGAFYPRFTIRNHDSGSLSYGELQFESLSSTPANNDFISRILARGKNSAGSGFDYTKTVTRIGDVTDGTEAGRMLFQVATGGTVAGNSNTTALELYGDSSGEMIVKIAEHDGASSGLMLGSTLVTSTAAELNKLDGATVTTAELNLLDGGATVGSSITIADSDGFIVNDNGVSKLIPASDLKTYAASSGGISNVVEDSSPQLGANLDLNGNDIVTTSNANLELAPHGTGVVNILGNTTGGNNQGAIRLNCEHNSHHITIKSPTHSALQTGGSYSLTLPANDGNANDVLQTDGSGALSWVAQSGGGGGTSYTYSAITATTTAQAWYHYSVNTSGGAVTLNLPALSTLTDGDEIRVKLRVAGNTLTIDANSTETIDGSQTYTLDVAYQAITLIAGSTEWEVV